MDSRGAPSTMRFVSPSALFAPSSAPSFVHYLSSSSQTEAARFRWQRRVCKEHLHWEKKIRVRSLEVDRTDDEDDDDDVRVLHWILCVRMNDSLKKDLRARALVTVCPSFKADLSFCVRCNWKRSRYRMREIMPSTSLRGNFFFCFFWFFFSLRDARSIDGRWRWIATWLTFTRSR